MTEATREFDIIIFGGTGYTGRYIIEELAISSKSTNLKWAIAGRNYEKLQASLQMVQEYLKDVNILNTPIIIADVSDKSSIISMCQRTKLILNAVGPFKLYGEIVVSSCIENKTDYADISGELKNLETLQANYFDTAREKGVYIVQTCGFDSIPADYGSSLLKNNFPGDLNSVEYYVRIKQGPSGRKTNIGTFLSAVESIRDFLQLNKYNTLLAQTVFKKRMVPNRHRLPWRCPIFYSSIVNGWCVWFIGPDERVIMRSQMFRNEYLNDRPIEVKGYFNMPSFCSTLLLLIAATFMSLFSLCSCGRNLLAKYPGFFTFGQFSKDGPTRQQVEEGQSILTLVGHGWKNKLSSPTEQHESAPDTSMKLTIVGPEPVYPFTSMCLVQAGLVMLQERDKLPLEGGVLTPGVAFENTTLSRRLQERGAEFTFENM